MISAFFWGNFLKVNIVSVMFFLGKLLEEK